MGTTDLDCGKRESRVTQFRLSSVVRAVLKVTFRISFRLDVRRQLLDGFPCKVTLTLRLLMSYIYMEHLFLMFLDHTQRRSTVGRTPLDE